MDKVSTELKVYFEDPFWVGIYERLSDGKLSVCKVTFGPEPKDCEVQDWVIKHFYSLRFSPSVAIEEKQKTSVNPKRLQREVHKQIQNVGMGTKSQQALKLQQEEGKQARKKQSREQKEAEQQRMFDLKQQKRKMKHKGH